MQKTEVVGHHLVSQKPSKWNLYVMGFCLWCLGDQNCWVLCWIHTFTPTIYFMSSHIIMILSIVNISSTYSVWESSVSKCAKMPPNLQDSELKEASAVYPEVAIVDREKRKILLAWVRCRSAGNGLTLTVEVHSTGKAKKIGLVEVSQGHIAMFWPQIPMQQNPYQNHPTEAGDSRCVLGRLLKKGAPGPLAAMLICGAARMVYRSSPNQAFKRGYTH